MRTVRDTKRSGRRRHAVPSVSIAGYTNAGKSSLLNRLTGAGVLVEDALFATLDPTTRRAQTADGRIFTLLRHGRLRPAPAAPADRGVPLDAGGGRPSPTWSCTSSTAAHPDPEEQVRAVREVLGEVGADKMPELLVVNKIDAADEETLLRLKRLWPDAVFVSARTGAGHRRSAARDRGAAAAPGGRAARAGAVRPG